MDLMDALGCDEATALRFGTVRVPWRGENLAEWVRTVAEPFGLDPARVRRVAEVLRGQAA